MNLFKLLNISAIFILFCLGLAISSTMKEVDAPFLAIPRVAFETSVPEINEEQINPESDQRKPIQLMDDSKTGAFATKYLDSLPGLISIGIETIDHLFSTHLENPLPQITLTIDRSNSTLSISINESEAPDPLSESPEEKTMAAVSMNINQDQPLENNPSTSESDNAAPTSEDLEQHDQAVIDESQFSVISADENTTEEIELSAESDNLEITQVEAPISESSETPVDMMSQVSNSNPETAAQPMENIDYPSMVYQLPAGSNPLTGLSPEADENLERRPMMVKISNFPRSGRPQAGLSYADMVFDYYIGEEMNRFLAIFYGSDSPQVGPIRSGALVDSQIANLYQGIINYGNEDPQIDGLLTRSLESRALPVWKCTSPAIEGADSEDIIGVFGNSEELSHLADRLNISNSRPVLEGMSFSDVVPENSENSYQVAVEYSERNRGEWRYDPDTGLFNRWSENFKDGDYFMEPLYDRVNNQQVKFANVVIIFADYDEINPTRYKIDLTGNREGAIALIFRDGVMVPGTWIVDSPDQPIQFFDRDEEPIALKPGNTWVSIVDLDSKLDELDNGNWVVQFSSDES